MQKRNSRPRLQGTDRVKMARKVAQLYATGKDIRAVADKVGVSYMLARTLLIEQGVSLRPRGGWGVTRGASL